ncbi:D-alanyl-D-alanine carboxypeptidase family protein [Phreatobacter stygius]|uniref:D-alanyl-D-alanine carboxypeptidase family protein n=1 Tax=Phreatobacter stygius TaxID=1940610 RepID=UPI001FEBFC66|nr:D-alanyl-D-alanine carboxypeptidase family protein [Phreatobacter stygius]
MRISAPALAATIALSLGLVSPAAAQQVGPTIVVDVASGQVLQADRAGTAWLPASLTKMMTAYVALSQVRQGRVTMNTGLTVSQRAARATPSKMGFRPGTVVTIDNALKIIMVKSANDVSVTIAEGLGGSVENFAAMMNAEARRLGMTATRFINPNGLPGAGQQTSARDMAVLARALMREFPEQSMLWRMPAIRYGNRVMRNHNHLIGRYPGADGFKTGFTCASGFNVVATATRGGRQLIVVVLGATSARGRAETAAGLFERHFGGFGGSGVSVDGIANDAFSAPANIRDQACRRRGRGPAYIESGEDLENEPIASTSDPGNLSYAQMMAQPSQRRSMGIQAFAAIPGQVPSLLGPYRPSMDPIPVFIGGAGSAPPPATAAPMLASTPGSRRVTLPASGTTTLPQPVAAGMTSTVTTVAAPAPTPAPAGAIGRAAAPDRAAHAPAGGQRAHGAIGLAAPTTQHAAPPTRPGAIGAVGAPMALQGAASSTASPAPAASRSSDTPQRPTVQTGRHAETGRRNPREVRPAASTATRPAARPAPRPQPAPTPVVPRP